MDEEAIDGLGVRVSASALGAIGIISDAVDDGCCCGGNDVIPPGTEDDVDETWKEDAE